MEYISVENQRALERRYRQAMMMALAFGASVLVLLLVAKFIKPGEPRPFTAGFKA